MDLHVNNLNEDEQLLISMYMYSNSAIAETEEGRSLEWDCLLEEGCFLRKKRQIRGGALIRDGALTEYSTQQFTLYNGIQSFSTHGHFVPSRL